MAEVKIPWWKNAVIYQIYPRSFFDSNGDGEGDLPGITSQIDYLQSLEIDAIWLSPFYESPNRDGGYDVSDPRKVDARFGTFDDFQRLIEVFHERNTGEKSLTHMIVRSSLSPKSGFILHLKQRNMFALMS